jgi:DNA-binding NarL/FixJ family response regulator
MTSGNQGTGGDDVTSRERDVLLLVAAGLREDEIAARLRIAQSSVELLLRSAMAKLDETTRLAAAARFATRSD